MGPSKFGFLLVILALIETAYATLLGFWWWGVITSRLPRTAFEVGDSISITPLSHAFPYLYTLMAFIAAAAIASLLYVLGLLLCKLDLKKSRVITALGCLVMFVGVGIAIITLVISTASKSKVHSQSVCLANYFSDSLKTLCLVGVDNCVEEVEKWCHVQDTHLLATLIFTGIVTVFRSVGGILFLYFLLKAIPGRRYAYDRKVAADLIHQYRKQYPSDNVMREYAVQGSTSPYVPPPPPYTHGRYYEPPYPQAVAPSDITVTIAPDGNFVIRT